MSESLLKERFLRSVRTVDGERVGRDERLLPSEARTLQTQVQKAQATNAVATTDLLAQKTRLPPAAVDALVSEEARRSARARNDAEIQALLDKAFAKDGSAESLQLALASSSETPPAVLARLAQSVDPRLVDVLLVNAALPGELLVKLFRRNPSIADDSFDVADRLAENPTTPATVLALLAKADDEDLRISVAQNPKVPSTILAALAADESSDVRAEVARVATDARLLERLCKDDDEQVVAAAASNSVLDRARVIALSKASDPVILAAVAKNPQAPVTVLARLAKNGDTSVRAAVAENPAAPPQVLAELAKDDEYQVRSAVAANPRIPPTVVATLSKNIEEEVLRALAQNAALTSDQLAKLVRAGPSVIDAIAANPKASAALLSRLAKMGSSPI
jgi:hypothetical protein